MAAPANEVLSQANQAVKERRFDDAAELLEGAVEAAPNDLQLLDLFGFVRFFQGRYADCEALCRRALELDPNRPYALKGLGLALARQGKVDDGQIFIRRAIAMRPGWLDPWWDLAVVQSEAGHRDKALATLEEAVKFFPHAKDRIEAFIEQLKGADQPGDQPADLPGDQPG